MGGLSEESSDILAYMALGNDTRGIMVYLLDQFFSATLN
jgi:hypothetical protein